MNRGQLRDQIRVNLQDAAITYYSDDEINQSIQDAYYEVCCKTLCLIRNHTFDWSLVPQVGNHIDFTKPPFSLCDYIGTYAIFNNQTNWWLRDDISIRDLDRIRRDWELWRGQTQFWTPHSLQYIVVAPFNDPGVGSFVLWYYAYPPTLQVDADSPLIAADNHTLIEEYATADMLETAEEITKAGQWWSRYEPDKEQYKERCHNLAKYDVLLRV